MGKPVKNTRLTLNPVLNALEMLNVSENKWLTLWNAGEVYNKFLDVNSNQSPQEKANSCGFPWKLTPRVIWNQFS